MTIYQPKTALEAVTLRRDLEDGAVYLAGGTDDLRLGGAAEGKALIDVNGLVPNTIEAKDGKLEIGALATFNELIESPLIPEFLKDAARFCASFPKRNSATIGGNLGLRRLEDGYLLAALTAAEAVLICQTPHGIQEKPVGEYLRSDCKCLIEKIVLDADRKGWVKRFGNTSSSHATLIAAESRGVCALSVHGSGLVWGNSPEIGAELDYVDDLSGGADYKRYLAKTVFTLRRDS